MCGSLRHSVSRTGLCVGAAQKEHNLSTREGIMAKFILFGLTPQLFGEIRAHANQQKISVSELVRKALRYYLSGSRLERIGMTDDISKSTSKFYWTQAKKEYADSVIQQHFDEDR
jgi:DNA-binding CsgD family transcriptional regulator